MCAQIYLKIKANTLAKKFGIKIPEALLNSTYEKMIHGYLKKELAPVIAYIDGEIVIKDMYFSLCPSWSKEFPCEWSTYNARMERLQENKKTGTSKVQYIYEVPTWKEAFTKGQICLVPLSGAIESSYFGSHGGNMIRFTKKHDETIYALGIWSEWLDKGSGELKDTFALLTDDPYEFFYRAGHDRSIIVIEESKYDEWLKSQNLSAKDRFEFIRTFRVDTDWDLSVERPLKEGWQKRAPSKKEISEIKVWYKAAI